MQEAHRTRVTDQPLQPGPFHPSGTRGPFPTAVSAGLHHAGAQQAQVQPRHQLGKLWGSQPGLGSLFQAEEEGKSAEFQSPVNLNLETQS